jgi:adenylosuccinate synthase
MIDGRVQLVLPYHRELDRIREDSRGAGKIGTTLRGIGPAYEERAARGGLRLWDLQDLEVVRAVLLERLKEVRGYFGVELDSDSEKLDLERQMLEISSIREQILSYMGDVSWAVANAVERGEKVVFEGAQGCLLDVTFGTVPFVTSSHTTAGGIPSGVGLGPRCVGSVLGLVKAYTTRVGSGPFPTELLDGVGDRLRERGAEFGTVTGRPRRCGWLDAVALRYSIRVSGIDWLALTKLDVLSGLDTLYICEGYKLSSGKIVEEMPIFGRDSDSWVPQYKEFAGWHEDITSCRSYDELPLNARSYLDYIASTTRRPIVLVGVGQSRDATIFTPNAPKELYEFVGAE